jgi:hypothetical protein
MSETFQEMIDRIERVRQEILRAIREAIRKSEEK